jgi:serine/threonine protein kinase
MAEEKAARDRVDAAFGLWALDVEKPELWPRLHVIQCSNRTSFGIYKDVFFVKMIENGISCLKDEPEPSRVRALKQEIFMTLIAGESCSLQPVGRVFLRGVLCGFIIPLGVPIERQLPALFRNKDKLQGSPTLLPPPKEQIDALTQLVSRLHTRGVMHGDIKPSNLIFCKETSRILFCDFGSAALENSPQSYMKYTLQYISPFRPRNYIPLKKADDLYATGITIWEISAGCVPFEDIDKNFLEDVVAGGFQPNLYAVPDTTTRQLVHSYLEAGQEPFQQTSICKSVVVCITADVVFTDCVAEPPHTYEKTVHSKGCCEAGCGNTYRAPVVLGHIENINCEKCRMLNL